MKVFVVDIEASGLHANSFPIELGWCALGSDQPESFLIKPASQWQIESADQDWDEVAETIHGISREMLQRQGHSVLDVVKTFNLRTEGALLLSDGAEWDSYWLGLLFKAADKEAPQLMSVTSYIADQVRARELDGRAVARAFGVLSEIMVRPHRAGADAQAIAALIPMALDSRKL